MDSKLQSQSQSKKNKNIGLVLGCQNSFSSSQIEGESSQVEKQSSTQLSLVAIKVHKQILKTRKNPLKGFVKRQLEVSPIFTKQLNFSHKYILFGYQDVETYYRDYSDPFDFDLVDLTKQGIEIQSIKKCMKYDELQVNVNNKTCSGITNFQFLIDHFAKFTDQNYRKLYLELIKYQSLTTQLIDHISTLRMKIQSRLIQQEEVNNARQQFQKFVENQLNQQIIQGNYFYVYQIYTLDVDTVDIKLDKLGFSLAFLSFMGIDLSECEQLLLHSGQSFQASFGGIRLNAVLEDLEMLNSGLVFRCKDTTIQTKDQIKFSVKKVEELIFWDERPEWASKYDFLMILQKVDLTAENIKYVIDERLKRNSIDNSYDNIENHVLEYVIQSEVFLEKFYPEFYKQFKEKKSVKLENENLP
ncbi:hypothetical protein TTHERM_00355410 (macronuclear) [Tetrahymena thermophila SB210]|uniref:Uncharacterized protein n=1 Tax=Tetrahymena thermophila (strain SB210) TaxID=312017 RepID=Q22Y30_TETTS|nr:hypothetical protein TTHERM_00355410 [Tetrahymena thermophila SB210]EAR90194.1 hypothetical protein TTHERM_00355410 [Tetrahymena thermophila SB210]|eukprot:XP_001010439.1 hypothetical protein TTHERM_00355410 [Tetrahymena thermophila SB210]